MASIFDLLLGQNPTVAGVPPVMGGAMLDAADSPLAALMQQPQPGIPPWIDLRGQRPANQIAGAPNILDLLKGLLPGSPMSDAQMAAVPGAVPMPAGPTQTPTAPTIGMTAQPAPLEQAQPLGPAFANAAQALIPPPAAAAPSSAASLPMVRSPQAPSAAAGGPTLPPVPVAFGLPPAMAAPGRTQTISLPGPGTAPVDPMALYANAIKGLESGGVYDKVGPTHPKLGRALGAYQVMEANVGPWTKEILGKEMTPDEFLKSPQAQDAVFRGKFGQYVQQTGTPEDAASMWHSGVPLAEAQGRKDSLGTATPDYVKKFSAGLNKPAGNAFAMPGAPNIQAPQLPLPPALEALKGINPEAFNAIFALKPTAMPKMATGDKLANLFGAMAAGGVGAKNLGDLLMGVGAGAGKGASANIAAERGDLRDYNEKLDALARLAAETKVRQEEARTTGENRQITARNENSALLNQVKTEQAKLDAAAKNKIAELQNQIDWKKWEMFQPQIHADKEGISVIQRKQDGGIDVTSHKLNDMASEADRITKAAAVYGKDSASVDAMRYASLAQKGEPWVRMQILRDAVEGNHMAAILGDEQFKKLQKEAERGIDPTLRGKPEEFNKQVKEKMLGLIWSQKLPDQAWLPYMLKQGNFGAALLARPAGG